MWSRAGGQRETEEIGLAKGWVGGLQCRRYGSGCRLREYVMHGNSLGWFRDKCPCRLRQWQQWCAHTGANCCHFPFASANLSSCLNLLVLSSPPSSAPFLIIPFLTRLVVIPPLRPTSTRPSLASSPLPLAPFKTVIRSTQLYARGSLAHSGGLLWLSKVFTPAEAKVLNPSDSS